MTKTIGELFDLSGKVAIVTGGAMGIGKGIALRLAEAGASVVIADLNLDAAMQTVAEMRAKGYKVKEAQADTSQVSDAEKTVQLALAAFGDLHILVNNAGIYPFASTLEMSERIWDKTLNVNLKGVMFFTQAATKAMVEKGHGGKIINIASVDGFHPTGNLISYDASKGGVVMMTKAIAKDLAPKHINVNAIAPGAIATPGAASGLTGISKEQIEALTKAFIATIPLGRQGEPDDIGRVALFLASEAADYITGTTIVADGGYLVG
ncbi:SDR family NAD(P)-dependent oxidoreductase [Dehalogenimonas alkenigignens]|uniref:Dehydrogenase n=1 Tax=Dehalogenimonas alkenigignens TaxID=1217799 RepID=A0A0W0GJY4_9CHLR|nr:SDR family oxidoreductase [Dehalogenimonas alkenigignens]KTB48835.1 Dehydrogenase [Dehalogenimonas alkenigignens]PVV84758.1 SDR family NAD(P)-dependent oxidoreductase [Dehalogenimonas alkenigignens]